MRLKSEDFWQYLLIAGAILLGWMVASSYLTVYFSNLSEMLDPWSWWHQYATQWWFELQSDEPNGRNRLFLLGTGLVPAVAAGLLAFVYYRGRRQWRLRLAVRSLDRVTAMPAVERANTDNFGHSSLMNQRAARAMFPAKTGKLIGQQRDGLLFDGVTGTSGVTLEFVGTRSYKSMRAVTMLAFWPDALAVFDPACELAHMTWRMMTARRRRVYIMNPDVAPTDDNDQPMPWTPLIAQTNVLSWINTSDPLAAMHIHTIAALFFEEDGVQKTQSGEFFSGTAESLLAALIAHVLWTADSPKDGPDRDEVIASLRSELVNGIGFDALPKKLQNELIETRMFSWAPPPPLYRDLIAVREFVSLPTDQLREALTGILLHSPSDMARRYVGPLVEAHAETFGDIHHTCNLHTRWLATDALANMVCGDSFDVMDITRDQSIAVFVQLPMTVCDSFPSIARVIFGTLMNCKIERAGETHALVVTDESWLLKARAIRQIVLNGGKYKVALHMFWQSVGDLDRVWDRNTRKSFFDSAAWIAVGPLGDIEAAREIAEACGTYGALDYSRGDNSSTQSGTGLLARISWGRNLNVHPVKRNVFFSHEVIQDLKREDRLILRLPQPLLVKAAPYFTVKSLDGWIDDSPFREAA